MEDKILLVIISSQPYNGSDAVWNAIRLSKEALNNNNDARIFLINEGVDAGRKGIKPPENSFNLSDMLKEVAIGGGEIKYCKTCIDRCGIGKSEMIDEIEPGSMKILHDWILTSDKVITF